MILENVPRIRNVIIYKKQACERLLLNSWEQRHCCILPQDLKEFYLSTDGLKLVWSYEYSPQDLREVGYMHIRSITEFVQLSTLKDELEQNPVEDAPRIGQKSRIIEFDNIDNLAKVLMIYEESEKTPKFWLLDLPSEHNNNKQQWTLLANSFSQYLRMSIAHLGLPQWQLCFSKQGMLPWAEQLFMLIAPHLLLPEPGHVVIPAPDVTENIIDESIFKPKPRVSKPTFRTN
ncbi:tubulin polyglutamylase complex subunit 2-like [Ctenocephalides felis]|uniref:tubulin polyglutamylase complex subunit 2-like n=1 Tax=Ctenocephalides felis TaxID=7515 RepID=UPI000E6E3719|nr:tubulin polyglutamylase complex subunit 2-like [Ctenocephalides felis]